MLNNGQLARIALVSLLIIGCFLVLKPFMASILFAGVICISTWGYYRKLWERLRRQDTMAAGAMTLLLLVALILPMIYLTANLADSANAFFEHMRPRPPYPPFDTPEWVRRIPLIGDQLSYLWQLMTTSQSELLKYLSQFAEPARNYAIRGARLIAEGLVQLVVVAMVAFFFYRDGAALADGARVIAGKLSPELGVKLVEFSTATVKAVMLGVFGTAIAQSIVAFVGFFLVGVPAPFLLATATFFLSVIPIGPPLIWGAVALWLMTQGSFGWMVFMLLYGTFAISSVDNVIKPILISHSTHLPLLLTILGVLGGVAAFGFIGIFLGPVLLALGLKLTQHWMEFRKGEIGEER